MRFSCFFQCSFKNTVFHFRAKKPVRMEEGGAPSAGGVVVRESSGRKRRAPEASDARYVVPPAKRSLPSKLPPATKGISKKPPAIKSAKRAVPDPAAARGEAELHPLGKSKVPPQGAESEAPKVPKASSEGAAGAAARQQAPVPPSSRWEDGSGLQVVGHRDDTWSTGKFWCNISNRCTAMYSGAQWEWSHHSALAQAGAAKTRRHTIFRSRMNRLEGITPLLADSFH